MDALEVALTRFLPRQRWFAGKGRELRELRVEPPVALLAGRPSLDLGVVAVTYADGGVERYQIPLGRDRGAAAERLAREHPGAVILEQDAGAGEVVYDGVHDPRLRPVFLDLLRGSPAVGGLRVQITSWLQEALDSRAAGDPLPGAPDASRSRLLQVEQSNTSLVYGERLILKLFRCLQPGENPELELTRALAAHGFGACPPPLGWMEGMGATLAILQPYYADSTEGWRLASQRAAACLNGMGEVDNFANEARNLGTLTAGMHAGLAAALPTAVADPASLAALRTRMLDQLARVVAAVPELAPYAAPIEAVFAELEAARLRLHLQRIHSDYHLGQVLSVGDRWVAIDFEGEPARSLEERRRLSSPLQDVAGMLRSFDYAAFRPLVLGQSAGSAALATAWVERNRAAFLDGYLAAAASGSWLPDDHRLPLRAFELDKAVYEVMYEARHRPAWLSIPLGGIQRLLERSPL